MAMSSAPSLSIVEKRYAAARAPEFEPRTRRVGHILEGPVAQVVVEHVPLAVGRLGMALIFEFRINMAIGDEQVRAPIVIEIEEAATPAQLLEVRAQFGIEGPKGEAGRRLRYDRDRERRHQNWS